MEVFRVACPPAEHSLPLVGNDQVGPARRRLDRVEEQGLDTQLPLVHRTLSPKTKHRIHSFGGGLGLGWWLEWWSSILVEW